MIGYASKKAPRVIPQKKLRVTVIRLFNAGGELDRVEIPYEDATTDAIGYAIRSMTVNGISEGDTITVAVEGED